MYQCPLCQSALTLQQRSWSCQAGHSFDVAREGYVNLLPVQQKKSLEPGDNNQMMLARRAFLEAGHYQALSTQVNQLLSEVVAPQSPLLDIGCGEGYYSARLADHLTAELYALDISKTAIRYAAKRYPQLHCAVASSYQLPYQTASFAALLRIYAPSEAGEMVRVLKPGGFLLSVSPAPEHLLQFKQAAYTQVRLHSSDIRPETGFSHHQRQRLQLQWQAPDAAAMQALMDMTPLSYKLQAQHRQQLLSELPAIQLDFYLDLYQRNS